MAIKKNTQKIIKDTAAELLEKVGLKFGSIDVEENKDLQSFRLTINVEQPGLLIGRRGETLDSFQSILTLILRNKTGDWLKVVVDVEGWRQKQEEHLRILAQQTAQKVIETGQEQALYNLSPYQRRVVHMELADNKQVKTESFGEGRERYLVVKPIV